ncbi:MAG: hypothetical protein Q4Q04_05550 [Methanocorpusculum sp.]|nr:hypothetical protein [Methanocorpusculum sp.]
MSKKDSEKDITKKEKKERKEQEFAAQVLLDCRSSMGQIFAEQETVCQLMEEEIPDGFFASQEFADALAAYKKRLAE